MTASLALKQAETGWIVAVDLIWAAWMLLSDVRWRPYNNTQKTPTMKHL